MTTTAYDAVGNVTKRTDADKRATAYGYDKLDQLTGSFGGRPEPTGEAAPGDDQGRPWWSPPRRERWLGAVQPFAQCPQRTGPHKPKHGDLDAYPWQVAIDALPA